MVRSRIVCVGSNLESRIALEGLTACGADIAALLTLPRQNPKICDYEDLHPFGVAHGIPVIDTLDVNSEATLDALREIAPDYIYTLGWSQLFRDELLNLPKRYIVGSHPAPLPQGRGRAPVPWTILQDCRRSAVTLFRMEAGTDSGAILLQREFNVPAGAYAGEVYRLVPEKLRDAFCDLHQLLESAQCVHERPQDESSATHRGKRGPEDGHLNFQCSAAALERLIRAVSRPYPGAYTYYNGQRVQVWRASLADVPDYVGPVGQILVRDGERLLVQAGDGPLWLSDFTDEQGTVDLTRFRVGKKFGFAVEDEICGLRQEVAELKEQLGRLRQEQSGGTAA